jgi:hypothetical protein
MLHACFWERKGHWQGENNIWKIGSKASLIDAALFYGGEAPKVLS